VGSSAGDYERWVKGKGALGMGRPSLKRVSAEDLYGGLPYWGPWKIRKTPDKDISHHRCPFKSEGPLESGGGSYTEDFE